MPRMLGCRIGLIAGAFLLCSGCFAPRSFKQVKHPREGRPLNDEICIVYSQQYQIGMLGLEKLHPFDINKYARIYLQLVTEGLICPSCVFVPEPIGRDRLLTVHTPDYLDRLRDPACLAEYLEFGPLAFAPSARADLAILKPFRCATGGTLLAARLAVRYGKAINLGGGYHHAEPDRGGGFCIYADMPIAIRVLQAEGLIDRVLIIDLDVHQGNGTAVCVARDDRVFTFDVFEEDIYPIPKESNDLDVPMPAYTTDEELLAVLSENLPELFERARPDIVFLQAGVDGLAGDPLAHFQLTASGIVERDRRVFAEADRRGVPIVMTLGGGYSEGAWQAQLQSIRSLIKNYGMQHGDRGRSARHRAARRPTIKERVYTK